MQSIIITEADFSENLKEVVAVKGFEIKALLERVNEAVAKLEESEKVSEMLEEIKQQESQLYQHMVSVSVLAQQIALWLKWDEREVECAALGGLLHDIGIFHEIGKKKRKIPFKDELEGNGYEKHITEAHHLLKNLKIDVEVIKAVLAHHERMDGKGFPMRLQGGSINKIGRVIAVADAYDIYTMKQKGEYACSVLIALKKMEDEGGRKLDSGYVQVFAEHIEEILLNKNVMLSDGRTGTIVMINKYDLLYPMVEYRGRTIDLSMTKRVYVEDLL